MFKPGQIVKCIDPGNAGHFRTGIKYKVVSIGSNNQYGQFIDDTGKSVRKACMRFVAIKEQLPPPKNDYEWLDRVQQNFKE